MTISIYNSAYDTSPSGSITLDDYLEKVKKGEWQDHVLDVRNGVSQKKDSVAVTPSAYFESHRRKDSNHKHSGFLALDLDEKDNPGLQAKKAVLAGDPYCYALHHSIGGFGLVWYVKINPEKHLESFLSLEKYLANEYKIIVDPSGKDVSRLRYVSYDPDLYYNSKSKKYSKYLRKPEKEVIEYNGPQVFDNNDMEFIISQINDRGVNITEDYHEWILIGFALASEFGENGRSYFHTVSAKSTKYNAKACDKQFDISIKRGNGGVGIGTFFYLCKRAGIQIKSKMTQEISRVYKQRIKSGMSTSEASKSTELYMQKIEGLERNKILPILKKLEKFPSSEIKRERPENLVDEIITFIKKYDFKFNEVTKNVELDGVSIDNRQLNTIYVDALKSVDERLQKQKIWDIINSDEISSYNPFIKYFESHRHLKPKGRITEVLDCFEIEYPEINGAKCTEYLDIFLKSWLISIISAMHGTFSLLTLVLCGGQGIGKTKFFRGLLPDDLKSYYADSKLEKEKESGMLMATKILICDDEFGGKNKTDAVAFKDLSSKEVFTIRRPYGKTFEEFKRYAVLCGTTNEGKILNDPTGNRRLIPINVININHKKFNSINKDELFMELYWEWKNIGDGWMLTRDQIKLLNASTEGNESENFERDMVRKYFGISERKAPNCTPKSTTEIKIYLEERTREKVNLHKLGLVMTSDGYTKMSIRGRNGKSSKKWLVEEIYPKQGNEYNDLELVNSNEKDASELDF